jgi:glycosyltransferase involved in cell wall biosynthesis
MLTRAARTVREAVAAVTADPDTTLFSIVIPTYNERADIGATLDAVIKQHLHAKEIIVVDGGSTDGTREYLRERARWGGIKLIEETARRGVAAARNAGMDAATGDVVVILNADVSPGPEFLRQLDALYREGAGMVSVQSRVSNMECATGRFIQAAHELDYGAEDVGWTEGFSCRLDAAARARFPEEIPGLGGEDVEFFQRLRRQNLMWMVDYSIVVSHRAPATLRGFWQQRRWRGNALPHAELSLRRRPLEAVVVLRGLAALKSMLSVLVVLPMARRAAALARVSPRGMSDFWMFWLLAHVQVLAHRTGEWETIIEMSRRRPAK